MERGKQDRPLAHNDRLALVRRQHLDLLADTLDTRRADEDRPHLSYAADIDVRFERLNLSAIRVAPHVDVNDTDDGRLPVGDRARARDHAGAGSEDGQSLARALTQGFEQPVVRRQLSDGRRLPAGDDERIGGGKLRGCSYLERVATGSADGPRVCFEVALEGENTDLHGVTSLVRRGAPTPASNERRARASARPDHGSPSRARRGR